MNRVASNGFAAFPQCVPDTKWETAFLTGETLPQKPFAD